MDVKGLRAVVDSGQRIVVADDEFTAQLLLPLYYRKIVLLADTPKQDPTSLAPGWRRNISVRCWS